MRWDWIEGYCLNLGAVVVAQLVSGHFWTPEIHSSNPAIGIFCYQLF